MKIAWYYNTEPRDEFRTINYLYVIDGTQVIAYDTAFNAQTIGTIGLPVNYGLPICQLVIQFMHC